MDKQNIFLRLTYVFLQFSRNSDGASFWKTHFKYSDKTNEYFFDFQLFPGGNRPGALEYCMLDYIRQHINL